MREAYSSTLQESRVAVKAIGKPNLIWSPASYKPPVRFTPLSLPSLSAESPLQLNGLLVGSFPATKCAIQARSQSINPPRTHKRSSTKPKEDEDKDLKNEREREAAPTFLHIQELECELERGRVVGNAQSRHR